MTFGIHRITIFLDQRLNRDWARVVVSWFKLINNFIYASRWMGCRWAAVFERLKAEGKQNYIRNKKGRKEEETRFNEQSAAEKSRVSHRLAPPQKERNEKSIDCFVLYVVCDVMS